MNLAATENKIKNLSYILWVIPVTMVFDLLNPNVNAGESFFYFVLHRIYHFSYDQNDLLGNLVLLIYACLTLFSFYAVYRFGKMNKKRTTFFLALLLMLCGSIIILKLNGKGWWNSPYELVILLSRLAILLLLINNIRKIKRVNSQAH